MTKCKTRKRYYASNGITTSFKVLTFYGLFKAHSQLIYKNKYLYLIVYITNMIMLLIEILKLNIHQFILLKFEYNFRKYWKCPVLN